MTLDRAGFLPLLLCAVGFFVVGSIGFFRTPAAHASSKTERERGAAVFHEKGCEHCHGANGIGTERGPVLSGIGRILHKPEIQRQIREGGKEMPPFNDALSNDEVQQLVAYLSAKKKKVAKAAARPSVADSSY
jgi:mono/diheme cytochrome c family protein